MLHDLLYSSFFQCFELHVCELYMYLLSSQKKVVDLVKKYKNAVTLAIGDGANDVGMIKGGSKRSISYSHYNLVCEPDLISRVQIQGELGLVYTAETVALC